MVTKNSAEEELSPTRKIRSGWGSLHVGASNHTWCNLGKKENLVLCLLLIGVSDILL